MASVSTTSTVRFLPTSACAAIARASSTSDRKNQIWKMTWCAATSAVPILAATAVASVSTASKDPVRRTRARPAPSKIRMSERLGATTTARTEPVRDVMSRMNHSAPIHCAITVAHAAPARPQPKPKMKSGSRTRLTALSPMVTSSGVLVS